MRQAATSQKEGTRYWVGYSIAFALAGVIGPVSLVLLTLAHAFNFGAGVSPEWLLLGYPLLIGILYLLREATGGEDVARGLFAGIRWGSLLAGVLVALALAPRLQRAISGDSGPAVVIATLILGIALASAGVFLIRIARESAARKRGASR